MLISALLVAACAAASPAATQGTPEDDAVIRGIAGKYTSAFNAKDAAGIAALVDESYQSVSPDGTVVKGRAALQTMEGEQFKQMQAANASLGLSATTDLLQWIGADAAVIGGSWSATGAKGSWMGVARKRKSRPGLIFSFFEKIRPGLGDVCHHLGRVLDLARAAVDRRHAEPHARPRL
jgi:ketosteroid isomerase-like protein